jgi:phage repressor protein C with HTH and peptisase S24 domain
MITENKNQSIFNRIEEILKEKGISNNEFQAKIGIQSQHWNNWKNRGVPSKSIIQIAETLGLNLEWLANGKGKKYKGIGETNAHYTAELGEFTLTPIVGTAQLGDNGHWYALDYPTGHGDGYIDYPSKDNNAYAIRCVGDSMRPRIKNGEFVIVEPNRPPTPGDEVLVKAHDGRVMVKVLLYTRDGLTYLQSINESHPSISIPTPDIEKMHYIAAIAKPGLLLKK